jgi:hypothetical protein
VICLNCGHGDGAHSDDPDLLRLGIHCLVFVRYDDGYETCYCGRLQTDPLAKQLEEQFGNDTHIVVA